MLVAWTDPDFHLIAYKFGLWPMARRRHNPQLKCDGDRLTGISATADGPRDAICQSKSCQLLYNSVGTTCTTSPEQIEVMELKGYSRPTCNKPVHLAMTRSTVVSVIHKLTVNDESMWCCLRDPMFSRFSRTPTL